MAAQKPIQISYTNDARWFPQIGPQLKAEYNDTTFHFDNEMGKGDFYRVRIDEGVTVRKVEMRFNQTVIFNRKSSLHPGYYVMVVNLGEHYVETSTQEKKYKFGYATENALYFSSPALSASYSFEAGVDYHLIFIAISHERANNFIARQPEAQHELLHSIIGIDKPLYYMEPLNAHTLLLAKIIDMQLNDDRPNNLILHAKGLELCHYMIQRVGQRYTLQSLKNIHPRDVKKLNEIRMSIMEHYQEPCPPLPEAARKSDMSPSKFKSLFKHMFGMSYYQFYKTVRMHKARELLEQQKMNVSEVGHMLGYNNLSKFSEAYKKMFAFVPSNTLAV
ncbi:MAG TPA: AraC family transcriptional regulator [Agriterribacter sp.]|nr:AraC family transcriptional regulator [Agriterribacter sp.]